MGSSNSLGQPDQKSDSSPTRESSQSAKVSETIGSGQPPSDTSESLLHSAAALPRVLLAGTRDLAVNLPRKVFEIDFDLSDTREELRKKIAWIIRIRFAVNPAVFLLMLVTNWQGLTKGASALSRETLISTALTAAFSIGLNLGYYLALKRERFELRKFVSLQLMLDLIIFAAYLWRTGGITSPFNFLFFLPIIGGSMLLSSGAGMAMAGIASLVFMLVAFLESAGIIPHVSYFVALDQFARRWNYVVLMAVVNVFAFVVVAAASGFLMRTILAKARELKESNLLLERKADLFRMLYQVSEVLQVHQGLDEVLDRICDVLVTNMNVDRALMYVVEHNELRLRRVAYHRRVPPSARAPLRVTMALNACEGLTARAAVENRAFNVVDPSEQDGINVALAHQIGMNPFAVAPMSFRGKVLGVLGIDRSLDCGVLREDEFDLLKVFARQAGQTLAAATVDSFVPSELPSG